MNEILFMPAGEFKWLLNFNPYHADFFIHHSSPFFSPLTCSIPSVKIYFRSEWKTVWILISWLHQKPADQDPHFFFKKIRAQQNKG